MRVRLYECVCACVCVFRGLQEYWALPRLSGTVSMSSVKDTIRQGAKGRGKRNGWLGVEDCVGGERKRPD